MKPRFILICAFVFLASVLCFAQSQLGTGAISGTVTDPSGQVVADAAVTVTSADTGLVRKVNTSGAGTFTVPVLPTGTYIVRVEKSGFTTLEQKGVSVNVGGTTTLALALQIGAVQSVVDVTAEAAAIDTIRSDESSLVGREQIDNLPNNGRRYDQFALMVPGVTRDGSYGQLTYRGISGSFNNFTVDGNDDNQAYNGSGRGYTRITASLSANAIQEFQVGKSNFLPEFGRAAGGNINAVVRSGSNRFHADGFEFLKNSALSARDPFSPTKPNESRHQFGGSVSGPIRQNKLFYFANYEQQIRDFPEVVADGQNTLSACKPVATGDQAACDAAYALIKSKFPGGAPGNTLPRTFNQNLALEKIDWLISPRNTFSVTYNYLNHRGTNGIQTAQVMNYVANNGNDNVRAHTVNSRLTSTISASLINEARFQWSRDFEYSEPNMPGPYVSISGGFSWGRATYLPRKANPDERKQQVVDNFSVISGSHAFKFGGEWLRTRDIINNSQNYGGSYSYPSVLALGKDLLNPAGRQYTTFTQGFGLPGSSFTTFDYGAFAQDQWKLRRNLTVNYGIRYDYQALPEPQYPNPAIPQSTKFNADRLNFGPRAGIAYDIFGNGKTVLRAGYGMMFARTPNGTISDALIRTGLLDPTKAAITISLRGGSTPDAIAPNFPDVFSELPSAARISNTSGQTRLDPDFQRPRVQEVNVGVDRQIPGGVIISASYVYTKGDRFPVTIDSNMIAPNFSRTFQFPDGSTVSVPFAAAMVKTAGGQSVSADSSRPNPNAGSILVGKSIGENWYQGMFIEAKRRFSNGFQFNVAYTLSKAENISGTGAGYGAGEGAFISGSVNVLDQFDMKKNRGIASTDQRHRLVANAAWDLPFRSDNPVVNRLVHGFRTSAIFSAESGRPYAATMSIPNLTFAAADGSQWTNLGGGLYGEGGLSLVPTIPRNSNYGDANYKIDLRLSRNFHLTERLQIELLGEGFNIFNRTNVSSYNTQLYTVPVYPKSGSPMGTPIVLGQQANWGTAYQDTFPPDGTGARRFQLSARFRF